MKDASKVLLAQGLDAEGHMMGHCVGSYCEQVQGGGTRIFSLRDPSGKPHVTVEVAPGSKGFENRLKPEVAQELGIPEEFSIQQIKGKQNAAPVAEYLPYVQDFIKNSPLGTPWGDVRELGNAGLYQTPQGYKTLEEKALQDFPEGHAAGGVVDIDDNAVDHLRGLFAEGGAVELEPDAVEELHRLFMTAPEPGDVTEDVHALMEQAPAALPPQAAPSESRYASALLKASRMHGIPLPILQRMLFKESAGNTNAVSSKGARGLMQFMPATAAEAGVDPHDPEQAIAGSAKYLRWLLKRPGVSGDMGKALAAYNWGIGNVQRKGMANAPRETQNYVRYVQGLA